MMSFIHLGYITVSWIHIKVSDNLGLHRFIHHHDSATWRPTWMHPSLTGVIQRTTRTTTNDWDCMDQHI